jgi:hypothetical protein
MVKGSGGVLPGIWLVREMLGEVPRMDSVRAMIRAKVGVRASRAETVGFRLVVRIM